MLQFFENDDIWEWEGNVFRRNGILWKKEMLSEFIMIFKSMTDCKQSQNKQRINDKTARLELLAIYERFLIGKEKIDTEQKESIITLSDCLCYKIVNIKIYILNWAIKIRKPHIYF